MNDIQKQKLDRFKKKIKKNAPEIAYVTAAVGFLAAAAYVLVTKPQHGGCIVLSKQYENALLEGKTLVFEWKNGKLISGFAKEIQD